MKLRKIKPNHTIALTPMLDVMTNLLIFLIVIQSPDQAEIENAKKNIQLPEATAPITKLPPLRVEIATDSVSVNGKVVSGLSTQDAASWSLLGETLKALPAPKAEGPRGIVVISDQSTTYQTIDRVAAQVARAGFSEVYFLSQKKDEENAQ